MSGVGVSPALNIQFKCVTAYWLGGAGFIDYLYLSNIIGEPAPTGFFMDFSI